MAIATQNFNFAPAAETAKVKSASAKPGVFARLIEALKASREAQARREIARHEHLFSKFDGKMNRDELPF